MSVMKTTGSFGYNAICDVCGFKFKAAQLRKRWDGYMVCSHDYETRHSLDFYTTRNDTHLLPWTRSDSDGIDVSPFPTPDPVGHSHTSVAGYAVAGFATAGEP